MYVDTCNSMRTLRLGDDCDQSQMMKVLLTHRCGLDETRQTMLKLLIL